MCKVTLKHTPSKKTGTTGNAISSLRRVSAAEHQTAEQCSKTGKTKPLKHLPRSSLSWNTCQDFLKIPTQLKIKAVATVDCGSIMCCDIGAIRQRHG